MCTFSWISSVAVTPTIFIPMAVPQHCLLRVANSFRCCNQTWTSKNKFFRLRASTQAANSRVGNNSTISLRHSRSQIQNQILSTGYVEKQEKEKEKECLRQTRWIWKDKNKYTDELGDYLEQLQKFHSNLESMIERGDRETVHALLEANFEAVMEQLDKGVKNVEQAAMLDVLIQLSMSLQDMNALKIMLEQMKSILMDIGAHEPFLDTFLEHTGSIYFALGNTNEALVCYERCLELQESLLGKDDPQLVSTLLGLAGVSFELKDKENAKTIYKRIISILENAKSSTCEELGVPLLHLGFMLLDENNPEDAELHIRRALNLAETNNSKGGGNIGIATCGLARVKYAKGDNAKAAELYRKGLGILKNSGYWASGDIALEEIKMEVAEFFSVVGRSKEAQELWEEILKDKENIVGVNSPRLVVHLQNLATSYAQDWNFEKCEPLLRRSLKLVTTTLGPTAPQVSIPLEFLATALHNLNKNIEAESLARQALKIRENNFPEDDPLIGEACNILASILHSNYKNEEALKYGLRALHIKEKHLGKDNMEIAGSLDLLLNILDSLGNEEAAFPLLKRLEQLTDKLSKPIS